MKLKKLSIGLCAALSLLMCGAVYAQQPGALVASILHIPPQDRSLYYLGQLFGSVEGVLASTSGQVMGHLFKVFNWGMELAAIAFMFYTFMMSVINTANEGSFMGERAKGMLRMIRSVAGVGMLVPLPSGYSSIQVFVLWMCVQGIGMADTLWQNALSYLNSGGVLIQAVAGDPADSQQSKVINAVLTGDMDGNITPQNNGFAMELLATQLCVNQLKQYLPMSDANNLGPRLVKPGVKINGKADSTHYHYVFGGPGPYEGICGNYQLHYTDSDNTEVSKTAYEQAAFRSAFDSMAVAGSTYISSKGNPGGQFNESVPVRNAASSALLHAATNYYTAITPVLRGNASDLEDVTGQTLASLSGQGWLVSGSLYQQLGAVNKDNSKDKFDEKQLPVVVGSATKATFAVLGNKDQAAQVKTVIHAPFKLFKEHETDQKATIGVKDLAVDAWDSVRDYGDSSDMGVVTDSGDKLVVKTYKRKSKRGEVKTYKHGKHKGDTKYKKSHIKGGLTSVGLAAGGPSGAIVMAIVYDNVKSVLDKWQGILKGMNQSDPILQIATLGREMTQRGVKIWINSSITIFTINIIASFGGEALRTAKGIADQTFIPMVVMISGGLIVNGVMFSTYIPLIPMLLFLFAALGWMMTVLEAVVAAPLVGLGITHPEGHDLLGKAEQAMMLLLSVFVRPACIVIGFFAATILLRVSLGLLNLGFSVVGGDIEVGNVALGALFIKWGAMIVYTLTIIRLIHFCYSLIHHVPDKIMKWIGLTGYGAQYGSGEKELGEIERDASSGMETATKAMTEVGANLASSGSGSDVDEDSRDEEWEDYCKENGLNSKSKGVKYGKEHGKKYAEITKKHTTHGGGWGKIANSMTRTNLSEGYKSAKTAPSRLSNAASNASSRLSNWMSGTSGTPAPDDQTDPGQPGDGDDGSGGGGAQGGGGAGN